MDFKPKLIRRDFLKSLMLTRRVTHKEDITMINAYALNVGVSNFITHTATVCRGTN